MSPAPHSPLPTENDTPHTPDEDRIPFNPELHPSLSQERSDLPHRSPTPFHVPISESQEISPPQPFRLRRQNANDIPPSSPPASQRITEDLFNLPNTYSLEPTLSIEALPEEEEKNPSERPESPESNPAYFALPRR